MGTVTLMLVLAHSNLHPKILDFAMFNGYRLPHSDQSLDEQMAHVMRRHPEMDRKDALRLMGDELNADVAEFFNEKFPPVGRRAV